MRYLLKRLWKNINLKRKKQLSLVLLFIMAASVTEVISIGAVIPFLGVLANPEAFFQHELAQSFINYSNIAEPSQLLPLFATAFMIAALMAGLMRIALLWGQTRLAHAIGADLSYQIYKNTLYQPYSVHLEQNSSEVISAIATKSDQVVMQTILPIMYIVSSIFMLIMILLTLIVIHPVMAIVAMTGFAFIYVFFIYLTKKRLHGNSKKISHNSNITIKALQEGLGGIRDVLIDGAQDTYCEYFRAADVKRRRSISSNQFMGQSPRYGVESLGMILITSLAFFLSKEEGDLMGTLPLLGALAIGTQRMLPMLQQAYNSWSLIRGSQCILQDALALLEQQLPKYTEYKNTGSISFHKTIRLNSLGFRYNKDAPWIFNNLNLTILKGSRIGFVGTTGSGKSTLLDIIMTLLHPSEGTLEIDDTEVNVSNNQGWFSHIAHIPQSIYLSDTTIAENIAFGIPKDRIDYQRVISAAKKAQIDGTIQSWDQKYDTVVGERGIRLSGGQRQRIGIARALYKEADVLIFDEATSALDSQTEKVVMDAIDDIHKDTTILMVAHRLSTLKNCDLIVELENGKIKRQGRPSEIIGI